MRLEIKKGNNTLYFNVMMKEDKPNITILKSKNGNEIWLHKLNNRYYKVSVLEKNQVVYSATITDIKLELIT